MHIPFPHSKVRDILREAAWLRFLSSVFRRIFHPEGKQERKQIEHAVFSVKFARRMREDKLPAETVEELRSLQRELKACVKAKDWEAGLPLAEKALKRARDIHPAPGGRYGLRENVEVFVVVLAVILGFRTYFLQPYQIPTGSMQPTLFGINGIADYEPDWTDRFPVNIGKFLLTGSRYVEIRAHTGGRIPGADAFGQQDGHWVFSFGNRRYRVHRDLQHFFLPGQVVPEGHVLASGLLKRGDFIVVNRLVTHFRPPRRGEIVVFTTRDIDHPQVRPNSAYIKRLVALPGESVAICDRELVVDGEIIRYPEVFVRQQEGRGYQGYRNPGPMQSSLFMNWDQIYEVGEGQFLFFGDNTAESLDGRYFGGVSGRNILGTAFFVPWPFFSRGPYGATAGLVY